MNKICTTIEQSKRLVELGIDVNTADMYHAPDANVIIPEPYITKAEDETLIPAYKGAIPCWSLTALLNILPSATLDTSDDHYCRLRCQQRCTEWHANSVDACVEMILKLKEKNLL